MQTNVASRSTILTVTQNDDPLIFSHFVTIACLLTCQNGGTLNETTCTCACADGYSGDTCRSECTKYAATCGLILIDSDVRMPGSSECSHEGVCLILYITLAIFSLSK